MATDADSFKFWSSYYDALKFLKTDEQRSEFIMGLCAYVFDGVDPTFSDETTEFGFRLIADSAVRSKEIAAMARENGMKGGRPRKSSSKNRPKNPSVNHPQNHPQKRSVACGSYAVADATASRDGACAPGACAPAPAPFDDSDLEPPPPPPPEP